MAIVKHVAIHQSPLKFLRYIINGSKTEQMRFVTGVNCNADPDSAYKEMGKIFEMYSKERFCKESFDYGPCEELHKEKIRLHHYIQSFAKGEITPEQAHQIGVEWARRVFGDDRQVIISTHTDKSHIHNHFAVAAYDLYGKMWYDNKDTLKHCRGVSDDLCRAYGLSVIENPQYRAEHKYSDWLAREQGASWKQKLCDTIDEIIVMPDVHSVDDLAEQLRRKGYEVSYRKYLSIKAAKRKKAIRSLRLGDGYGLEELKYRIENKEQEMSLAEVAQYSGIQQEYAMCLRELQIIVYRRPESQYRASYKELRKNAELLTYLCEKNITSETEFAKLVDAAADKCGELKKTCADIREQIKEKEKISEDGDRYVELNSILLPTAEIERELKKYEYLIKYDLYSKEDVETHRQELVRLKAELPKAQEQLEAAETEKKESAQNYQTYLRQRQTDYDFIYEKLRREKEEMEKAERQIQNERNNSAPAHTRNNINIIGE